MVQRMKSFWISLLFFILLMCSCGTKKSVTDTHYTESVQTETSILNESTKVDTTKTIYTEQLKDNVVIKETIVVTEYDKDSGIVTKKTETEREIRQSSDKLVEEIEAKGVVEFTKDSTNHIVDANKMVDEETKSEIKSDSSAFSKYFGISFGCVIGLLLVYLLSKYRIN